MKIAIASDSNSGITLKEAEELDFYILPTPILIDGEQYFQDVNITEEEFYAKMRSGAAISTSQPNPYSAEKLWLELLDEYDQVIYFPISSGLSTTCFNLKKLAEEKFEGKVFVIDNKRVSIPLRQSMMDAKKMIEEGKTADEIEESLLKTSLYSSIYIMVDDLSYLKRSGRINAPVAFFGNLLNIKPILQINGGMIEQYKRVRKSSEGRNAMIKAVKNDLETRFKDAADAGKMALGIAHTQNLSEAEELREQIEKEIPGVDFLYINPLNLSVAVHTGPGAIATGCFIRY